MKAVKMLYNQPLSKESATFIDKVLNSEDYEKFYFDSRESEREGKEILDSFRENNPDSKGVKANEIIERARRKKDSDG
ncbi:MAG: hypothetical protein FWE74_02185 [Oscillospiraceae bacterium]|nr:hypothetical protein [Oscillospiraceae bacterium]